MALGYCAIQETILQPCEAESLSRKKYLVLFVSGMLGRLFESEPIRRTHHKTGSIVSVAEQLLVALLHSHSYCPSDV